MLSPLGFCGATGSLATAAEGREPWISCPCGTETWPAKRLLAIIARFPIRTDLNSQAHHNSI